MQFMISGEHTYIAGLLLRRIGNLLDIFLFVPVEHKNAIRQKSET